MATEFQNFFEIIQKRIGILILTVIVLTLATYFLTVKQSPTFQATATIVISRKSVVDQTKVSYYIYDNYYAIQASGLLTDTILSWLTSASTVVEIYQKAEVPVPEKNASKLSKIFKSKKQGLTSNVAELSLSGRNKDEVNKLMQTALVIVGEKAPQLGQTSTNPFEISTFGPQILTLKPPLLLNTLIAFIASIFLGLFFISLSEYFSKK